MEWDTGYQIVFWTIWFFLYSNERIRFGIRGRKNRKEYVDAAHAVGALCYYDQANVNGIMGITRAKEAVPYKISN